MTTTNSPSPRAMGKKNKNDNIDKNISDSGIQKKKQKKKINKDKSDKAAKSKKIIIDDEAQTSNDKDSAQIENNASVIAEEVSRTKPKNNKNKKIIFGDDDDEPRDVSLNCNDRNSNKNININYEEEPKDEDIDKFCDEIDEEDNEQYENWIKLVEAKLSSNKRKV